ncbi:MAG TPA: glutamate--tRNA ligase [Acidimicrobiales bacterium]|nr:glutamate--tRNA ligase [Acidimicrobiales bacterium]
MRPRVRFAPSPTGYFHVGSARTALFNWLYARQQGGTFVLRIEDTDTERNRAEWTDGILSALSWLGMEPDEGPYHQSERGHHYRTAVDLLWSSGALYACDCTREAVDERTKQNATPGYDGFCRDRGLGREGHALRFRVPGEGETVVRDVIRGDVAFPHAALEDFVVVRSNGNPLFLLVNVVDDAEMRITHVIRGEDLLPSTPKQLLLWAALEGPEAPLPVFAHLPMLVNEQRRKLSKRKDPVAVESYRDEGYVAPAVVNYLALLGWSPPDGTEILGRDALVEQFRLEDVNHAPAFFDIAKMRHVNGEYIRAMAVDDFVDACVPWTHGPTTPWPAERFDDGVFRAMAPLVQERVTVLGEVPAMVDFLFLEEPPPDDAAWAGVLADEGAAALLDGALEAYGACEWDAPTLHAATLALAEAAGRKLGKAQAPIRLAVTGRKVGPPLFESMEALGREPVLDRLRAARRRFG